jgi:hypothetical protein
LFLQQIDLLEPRALAQEGVCEFPFESSMVKYLAEAGSKQLFKWRVRKGDPNGTCRFLMGSHPRTLKAIKVKGVTTNSDGTEFACGRIEGFEQREVMLSTKSCSKGCLIQMEWTITNKEKLNYCAGAVITEGIPVPSLKKN